MNSIEKRYAEYLATRINTTIHENDKMLSARAEENIKRYFGIGREAVDLTAEIMTVSRKSCFDSILEFPSGHGRITRHLTAFFPDAEIAVSDLFPEMLTFCKKQFGVMPLLSQEDFVSLDFGRKFDLIWCGSLLTHLPEQAVLDCFDCIIRHLAEPGGIGIITFVGEITKLPNSIEFYGEEKQWLEQKDSYLETGFAYFPYTENSKDWGGVGNTITRPDFVMKLCANHQNIKVIHFSERKWGQHQDVLVIEKI